MSDLAQEIAIRAARHAIAHSPAAVKRPGTVSAVVGAGGSVAKGTATVLLDGTTTPVSGITNLAGAVASSRVLVEFRDGVATIVDII